MAHRKKIQGFGRNDACYNVNQPRCKYFATWQSMLKRCYDGTNPSYIDVTVCKEWKSFMVFRIWMEKQDWIDKFLDKDILDPFNKQYSPRKCMFVTRQENNVVQDTIRSITNDSVGTTFIPSRRKPYQVRIGIDGKAKTLGYFTTKEEGNSAWKEAKIKEISKLIPTGKIGVDEGLKRHIQILKGELKTPEQEWIEQFKENR